MWLTHLVHTIYNAFACSTSFHSNSTAGQCPSLSDQLSQLSWFKKKKKRVGEFFSSCFSFELPTMYSHSVSSSVFCYCRLLLLPLRVGKQLAIMWQLFLAWLYAPSQDKHVYHCTPNSHNVSYKRFGDSMWIENMITKCCEKGSSVCSAKNFFFFFWLQMSKQECREICTSVQYHYPPKVSIVMNKAWTGWSVQCGCTVPPGTQYTQPNSTLFIF